MAIAIAASLIAPAASAQTEGDATAQANRTVEVWEAVLARVGDATQPFDARINAAQEIMLMNQQRSLDALVRKLQAGDTNTRTTILAAMVGLRGTLPEGMSKGLFDMMLTEAALQRDLAEIFGRYDDPRWTRSFIRIAVDPRESLTARRGATQALGHRRSKESVRTLIDLVSEPEQVETVRASAFDSLRELTGMRELPNDAEPWNNWYAQEQSRDGASWYEHLLTLHARNAVRARREHQNVLGRLVTATQQAYRSLPHEERQASLVAHLSDDLEPIRLMATNLCSQRLIDNQPFDDALRTALRDRLNDPSIAVQQKAVGLLENLADERAADIIAQRLASGERVHPDLLRPYLVMMARVPREKAVDRIMVLLGSESLTNEAAAALVKAWDVRLLNQAHSDAVARRFAEMRVGEEAPPAPQVIELLGRIGTAEYWPRIEAWMDSSDAAVKRAAALAWAKSDQPLTPLNSRASDPDILPIAIDASAQRASTLQEMLPLAKVRPEDPQRVRTWEQALITVAERAGPSTVLKVNDELAAAGNNHELREAMLSAVIRRFPETPAEGVTANSLSAPIEGAPWADTRWALLTDLLLRRAELRLKRGDATAATADLDRIQQGKLIANADQQRRLSLELFATAVATGRYNDAYTTALPFFRLAPQAAPDADAQRLIVDTFIASAQRSLATQQFNAARDVRDNLILLARDAPQQLSDHIMRAVQSITSSLRNETSPDPAPAPAATPTPPAATG